MQVFNISLIWLNYFGVLFVFNVMLFSSVIICLNTNEKQAEETLTLNIKAQARLRCSHGNTLNENPIVLIHSSFMVDIALAQLCSKRCIEWIPRAWWATPDTETNEMTNDMF